MTARFVFACFLLFDITRLVNTFDFNVCSSAASLLAVSFDAVPSVKCGTSYTLHDVKSAPTISYPNADENSLYEVLMIDPDAPSQQNHKYRSWLHYLRSNVKGSDLKKGINLQGYTQGNEVVSYNPPTPPRSSGYHRYIILVSSHTSKIQQNPPQHRGSFNVGSFLKGHKLSLIPDAVNMFKTNAQ